MFPTRTVATNEYDRGIEMNAWTNQFEHPTRESLIAGLDEDREATYQQMITQFSKLMPSNPSIEWLGVRWRWCNVWTNQTQSWLDTLAIIPDPDGIRIAAKLSTSFFVSHPPSSLPKALHASMSTAVSIGHQTWCEWPMNSQDAISSICTLIELALRPE